MLVYHNIMLSPVDTIPVGFVNVSSFGCCFMVSLSITAIT